MPWVGSSLGLLFVLSCTSYKPISDNGKVRTMAVYYEVIPEADAVELRYSFDAKTWYVDTLLLAKDTMIERPYRPYNMLRVILTNKEYFSRIIHLK